MTYEITTIQDILKIPPESFDRFLIDIKLWYRQIQVVYGFGRQAIPGGQEMRIEDMLELPQLKFTWTDSKEVFKATVPDTMR